MDEGRKERRKEGKKEVRRKEGSLSTPEIRASIIKGVEINCLEN